MNVWERRWLLMIILGVPLILSYVVWPSDVTLFLAVVGALPLGAAMTRIQWRAITGRQPRQGGAPSRDAPPPRPGD